MRARTAQDRQLLDLIDPIAESLGLDVVRVRLMTGSKRQRLQIMAERPSDHDISVEQCAKLSRAVSEVFDAADPIPGEYMLEVSSPGMDRPLFTLEQFAAHVGEQVKIKLRSPFDGRRNFQGLLRGVEDQDVVVLVDDHEFLLPIDLIDKANIIPRFD